jgi:ribosomal protein S18 acetylase RimI-like enzyme
MNDIHYTYGDEKLLDDIKELWECLNEYHMANSQHFVGYYRTFKFENRKADILLKSQKGSIRVEFAYEATTLKKLGYCISSTDDEEVGEIESIFILSDYRGMGIGEKLMKSALEWMDEIGAAKRVITVAAGNEQAFGFYEKLGFYPRRTVLEQIKK